MLAKAVNGVYEKKKELIIIGLTGRTGSGCSTVARILKKSDLSNMDLRTPKCREFENVEERKYSVIHNYMNQDKRWQPFTIVEISSVIFSFVLEYGIDGLINYLDDIQKVKADKKITISDYDKVKDIITGAEYMFREFKEKFRVELFNEDNVEDFFEFYLNTINEYKARLKTLLASFSCYETYESKIQEKHVTKYHLYTYLMQTFGNNVRATGNPYKNQFKIDNQHDFVKRIDFVIRLIINHDKEKNNGVSRICLDAIRNPFEASYLRDTYRAFYLMSINTDDESRIERLSYLSNEEIKNLDSIEYPSKMKQPEEMFYHQNIQGCLELADIHIYNGNVENNKFYRLSEQILRYIALMIHPGLITPTNIERCMQLAYNCKLNSGCISRQVGAVVTDEKFSVKSVGWNDAPQGQVSCNLRDVGNYCVNRDTESYSEYELCDSEFVGAMNRINNSINKDKMEGMPFPFCFKDIYNGIKNTKNQVYTRSLHAEENAFLQISKHGGTGVKNGKLFTTASPCELCAKKAYQLGIKDIYYIDPYPGISKKHILTFGDKNNPQMYLFSGAIGNAYISLYSQIIPYKDEIELISNVDCGKCASKSIKSSELNLGIDTIKYNKMNILLIFESREEICCIRDMEFEVKDGPIDKIDKMMIWTGSSYDGTVIKDSNVDCDIISDKYQKSPYHYSIKFKQPQEKGAKIYLKVETKVKDEEHVMNPYLSHRVEHFIDELHLKLICPKELAEEVCSVEYADKLMKVEFQRDEIVPVECIDKGDSYEYNYQITKPNLFYNYCIEWNFKKDLKK